METHEQNDEGRKIYEIVPGQLAQIEWRDDEQRRVAEVIVFNREKEFQSERDTERRHRLFPSSHGACVAGWMDGRNARATPEGQFADWLSDGFANQHIMLDSLDELGRIEEAGWARTMAKAMREMMRRGDGDDRNVRLLDPLYQR